MFANILEFLHALINGLPLTEWYPCDIHATPGIEVCPPPSIELIPAESGSAEYPV